MIVDSSALVAVLFGERGYEELKAKLDAPRAVSTGIGAPTAGELGLVLSRRLQRDARADVARLFEEFAVGVVPFTGDHWRMAVDAFWRFGKGRHRAGLNMGDCFTYATAKLARQPLLFVGNDFGYTDLDLA